MTQTPLTLIEAKNLRYGQHIYSTTQKYKNGLAKTVKINGAPKTWKRQPERVQIPAKYGLYEYFYITELDLEEWSLTQS